MVKVQNWFWNHFSVNSICTSWTQRSSGCICSQMARPEFYEEINSGRENVEEWKRQCPASKLKG